MSDVIELKQPKAYRQTEEVRSLLVEHLQTLRRFAYALTKDMHDADDLVQRVAEKLLNKSIPVGSEPLPWIFRVCKNTWIDEIRSRNVRKTDDDVTPESLSSGTDDKPDTQLDKRDLTEAIDRLPDNYRVVIQHVVVGGLSYAETANALDVPIGTVMSRVARARQQLADMLSVSE